MKDKLNHTAHNILRNEITLILPQIPGKQKHSIITTIVSSFIGLAYEVFLAFYITQDTKLCTRQSRHWTAKQQFSTTN